jgi:hypothetical protein
MRQTVSVDGADEVFELALPDDEPDDEVDDEVLELLELQPVIASAAAATPATAATAADLFLSPTAGTPSA